MKNDSKTLEQTNAVARDQLKMLKQMNAFARRLEKSGMFRVLRRLEPMPRIQCNGSEGLRCAIVVDTETTGLVFPGADLPPSEIVSLAMVAIAYDPADGVIAGVIDRFHRYRQPSHSIPAAATALHGITDELVHGCTITEDDLVDWIERSSKTVLGDFALESRDTRRLPLLIAHNAAFDRRMVEYLYPRLGMSLPWACSQIQVPWEDHGFEGLKLSYLGISAGFFYGQRHTALADADAVVELLRQQLGKRTAMARICAATETLRHRPYVSTRYDPRIIATLKARGYRWSNGDGRRPKAWYWEGDDIGIELETAFFDKADFSGNLERRSIDCFDRFSARA